MFLRKVHCFLGEKSKLKRLSKLYRFATKKSRATIAPIVSPVVTLVGVGILTSCFIKCIFLKTTHYIQTQIPVNIPNCRIKSKKHFVILAVLKPLTLINFLINILKSIIISNRDFSKETILMKSGEK